MLKQSRIIITSLREMIKILWDSSKKLTLLMIFNNLIRNGLWPIRALLVKKIIDVIVLSLKNGYENYQHLFWFYVGVFFIIFWSNRIWWPLNSYTQTLMLAKMSHHTKQRIISIMETVNLDFFSNSDNYSTYTRALAQAEDRRPIQAVNTMISFGSLIISFITAFSIMISIHIPITLILILSSIPSIIWEGKFHKKVFQFDQDTTKEKRFLSYIFSLFMSKDSSKEIRIFKTDKYLINKYDDTLKSYNNRYFRLINLKFKTDSLFWLILQLALMIGYYNIISETVSTGIALGTLSYFLAVASDLQNSLKEFSSNYNSLVQSSKYFDNILQFERDNMKVDNVLAAGYETIPATIHSIEFRNVTFTYPSSKDVILKNVSFSISNPQSVVLVGENGAGKTTLIKLLMGFYKPSSGEILLNHININKFKRDEYYRLFAVCFQDYMKYAFSLRDNILMQSQDYNEEEFNHIIEELDFKDVIEGLANKENTYLSREYDELGTELSGGQYNKIAIARAMAKISSYPDSIVVFDEPNAALDAKAEQKVFRLYEKITKERIGIMITHRLSTAVDADLILVLKDGELIELGIHEELINNNGEYASLFHLQAEHYITSEEILLS